MDDETHVAIDLAVEADEELLCEALKALKEWSFPYIDYVGFIDSDAAKRLERTRATITKLEERLLRE